MLAPSAQLPSPEQSWPARAASFKLETFCSWQFEDLRIHFERVAQLTVHAHDAVPAGVGRLGNGKLRVASGLLESSVDTLQCIRFGGLSALGAVPVCSS